MYDVVIIGSGPAGLGASIYAKRANLSVVVIEREYEGTGQIAESGQVDNYLGLPAMGGFELGENFRNHAVSLGVSFVEANVTGIEIDNNHFYTISLERGASITSKTIIYAAGASPRKANIPGEEKFTGKGVSYCALCDGAFYKQKTVAVLGGGDTALDNAEYLSKIAQKVYLVHRRTEFRGAANTVERLKDTNNVEFVLGRQVTSINGEQKVTEIEFSDQSRISVDGAFVAFGSVPNTKLIDNFVDLDENGYVAADESGITSQPGLFVAGDVRRKSLRQVITAVSDGANAVVSAYDYIKRQKSKNL